MTSVGDSPRPFNVADSQADMDWLNHQLEPISIDTSISNVPPHVLDNENIILPSSTFSNQPLASEQSTMHNRYPTPIKLEEFSSETVKIIINTDPVDLTIDDDPPIVHWKENDSGEIEIPDSEDERRDESQAVRREFLAEIQQAANTATFLSNDENGEGAVSLSEETIEESGVMRNGKELSTGTPTIQFGNCILRTPNSKVKRSAANTVQINSVVMDRAPSSGPSDNGPETDSLFVPVAPDIENEQNEDQEVEEVDGSSIPNTRGKPRRKRQDKHQSLTEKDLEDLRMQEFAASLATRLQRFNAKTTKGDRGVPHRERTGVKNGKKKKQMSVNKVTKSKAKGKNKSRGNNKLSVRAQEFMAGLRPHDVLAEANANLGRAELPSVDGTDKQKFLSTLLRSVPNDDRPGVRGEKTRLNNAALNFGYGMVKPAGNAWSLKGMKSHLLHHQLLGASFMRDRELGTEQPFGGLLADEMGFGKTVMMIVTMATNPPQPNERRRSTLIVCSPALLYQWQRELGIHANTGIFKKVLIHHASSRLEGAGTELSLEEADVVLTTYGQVVKSFPLEEPPEDLETAEERRNWFERHWSDHCGVLHRAYFHRVVLDEAQAIKNHKAHTSIACQAIMARYRWAISGTPIMNRIEELYPYFKFLRVPFAGSFDDFRTNFCGGNDPVYIDRVHVYLQKFMLRRTHKDLIFGAPIIKLPECHPKTTTLRPTKVEIAVYRAIETHYAYAVNAIAKWATEEQLKRLIMAMITRLRQMTAHIFLVQQVMQDIFELGDIKQLWNLIKDEVASRDTVVAMSALIDHKEDDEEHDDGPSAHNHTSNDNAEAYNQPSGALLQRFRKYLNTLITDANTAEFSRRSTCSKCGGPPEDPYLTSCMHVYCHECLVGMAHQAAQENEDGNKCLECGEAYTSGVPCVGIKELNYDLGTGIDKSSDNKVPKKRHKAPKDLLKWIRKDGGVLPSTKSAAVTEQIDEWLTKEPDKKIIVFSQWHMMMQIVVQDCTKHGWGFCTYHGAMTNKQREKAIIEFESDPNKKVLVASLKCGGLGLNLTMASKIICVDLWFNSFVEQQAFCRIFRIGQQSETYINRFVLKGTVDERLIALQERKKKLIGKALGDTQAFKHFTGEDLMSLFGTVRYDENSKPFVVVEDTNKDMTEDIEGETATGS